jgi:hypothetical protein
MPSASVSLLGQLDFWLGVGRLLVNLALIAAMYFVVMSISGHPVRVSRPRPVPHDKDNASRTERDETDVGEPTHHRAGDSQHLAHLDLLANLRHSLELQGATVVLIVFAVVLLGFNRVLGGPEVSTILAGITGYVLGTRSQASPPTPPPQVTPPSSGSPTAAKGHEKSTN